MQTSQIKEKLVQMLDVVNSIEKVEMELRAILGPINQYALRPINQYVMLEPAAKAKPRGVRGVRLLTPRGLKGWRTKLDGTFSSDNIKKAINKIWYYTKENTNTFNPKEITMLVGIESNQQNVLWRKIGQELGLASRQLLKREPNRGGKYQYKLTSEAAAKIKKLIA